MSKPIQIEVRGAASDNTMCEPARRSSTVFWLQGITLGWMLAECGVSGYSAVTARSPALAAFGSDSLVELLSAGVVLMQFLPEARLAGLRLSERKAARMAGVLLFVLAGVVGVLAVGSLVLGIRPEASRMGMAITLAALVVMPVLAWLKRREALRSGNRALAADAVQSATCAYLAAIVLVGLTVHAWFGIAWFDSAAALVAIPLLLKEAREAWRGNVCGCC